MLHRDEEESHAGAGDEFEAGEIKDQLGGICGQRRSQLSFEGGDGGVVEIAFERERDFAAAGRVGFTAGMNCKGTHSSNPSPRMISGRMPENGIGFQPYLWVKRWWWGGRGV
jgi:hypothetical protein